MNPKDIVGAKKVDLSLFPAVALLHAAHAQMDGAAKYGPYNWRDYAVEARTYVAAAKRHIDAWLEGEEFASDSGVHHLGHAIACCGILLDAMAHDKLVDNRPKVCGAFGATLASLNAAVKVKSDATVAASQGDKIVRHHDEPQQDHPFDVAGPQGSMPSSEFTPHPPGPRHCEVVE